MATARTARTPTIVYEEPQLTRPTRDARAPGELFWAVAAAGIGVLILGQVVSYFMMLASGMDLPARTITWLTFYTLGSALLAGGLALASVTARELAVGVRAAFLLGAAFFTAGGLFSGLFSLMGLR